MRKIKSLAAIGMSMVVLAGLTACTTSKGDGDRTAGRVADDKNITQHVESRLSNEPTYKFNDVDVKTFAGVVQLSGFVNTDEQKQRAAQIAQNTPGVSQVINSIALKPQQPLTPTGRSTSGQMHQDQDQNPVPAPTYNPSSTNQSPTTR